MKSCISYKFHLRDQVQIELHDKLRPSTIQNGKNIA